MLLGGREGEREREIPPADSPLSRELNVGLSPRTLRSWSEPKSKELVAQPTQPPRCPYHQ